MKALLSLCLALLVVCCSSVGFHTLIHKEVESLLKADKDLTVDHCATKCDALFDLVNHQDERLSDMLCEQECLCHIQHRGCNATKHPHHSGSHTKTTTPATTTPVPTTIAPTV